MNLFEVAAKIELDTKGFDKNVEKSKKKGKDLAGSIGKGLKSAGKIGLKAVGVAATGLATLTGAATKSFADYEQLVGGVETLFKSSANTVQQYAANAYKTAGMSANEYMETVTGFSASLLQSLGGDTDKAAKVADMAITDMSDNANKMGTDIESIKTAYGGFAKQNFTMLDNLKLGYGGTKEEMQRLLDDAERLSGQKFDLSSYADITQAIHVIQTEMGITGTTAKEASETISGSLASAKSAFMNLLTGIADDQADFDGLMNNFVDSVATAGQNILPRIQIALQGAGQLLESAIPVLIEQIPVILNDTVPTLLQSGVNILMTIINGMVTNADVIVDGMLNLVDQLVNSIGDLAPDLIVGGVLIIGKLAVGLVKAIPDLIMKIPEIITGIVNAFAEHGGEFANIGKDLIVGLWNGIKSLGKWIWDHVSNFFSGIVDGVKGMLGIHSPSKIFAGIGQHMAEGVGVGWDKEFSEVNKDIDKSMDFGVKTIPVTASTAYGAASEAAGAAGTTFSGLTIQVNGANIKDEQKMADMIAERLQVMVDRRGAVYA